ncbi:MAG: aquaporin [Chloroflexota bacterium]
MNSIKVFVAEFIGTFALVLVASAAGIYGQSVGLLGSALAQGLTVAAFIYVYGNISGMHINPAVTFGLTLNGTVKWGKAAVYWVAQFAGAAAAAYMLHAIVSLVSPDAFAGAATSGLLTDTVKFPFYYAMGLEALLTFFLVNAVLHTTAGENPSPFAGLAIGFTLAIGILAGGPLTGASMNPARTLGPAFFTSALTAGTPDFKNSMLYAIYFVGPLIGSLVAALLYQFLKYEPIMIDDMDDDEMEVVEFVEEVVIEEPVKKPVRKPAASKLRKTTKK